MFNFLGQVFLSSGNISFPTLCAVNSFTNNPKVSALFPSFSGYPIPSEYFYASDKNHTYVTLPSFDIDGVYDVILYNVAGYSKLSSRGYLLSSVASSSLTGLLTIAGGLVVTIKDPLSEITLINH
jgi:hypothetical protein